MSAAAQSHKKPPSLLTPAVADARGLVGIASEERYWLDLLEQTATQEWSTSSATKTCSAETIQTEMMRNYLEQSQQV